MKLNECVAVNCEMTLTILCIQNAIKSLIMFYHRGAQAEKCSLPSYFTENADHEAALFCLAQTKAGL